MSTACLPSATTTPPTESVSVNFGRTRRNRRQSRDAALHRRFTELYDSRRQRLDDVIRLLADEFYLTPRTVHRILKRPLSPQR